MPGQSLHLTPSIHDIARIHYRNDNHLRFVCTTDYANFTLSVSIPAGNAPTTINVSPVSDALVEGTETVVLTLVGGAQYDLGPSGTETATVTIQDTAVTPLVSVVAIDSAASEVGSDPGLFRFTRTGRTTSAVTVSYAISGTAINGVDYVATTTSILIAAGETFADLVITPIVDDLVELGESVIITVTDSAEYDVGSPGSATVTIADTGTDCGPEGGPLTNGATHCGTIATAGETDTWTFTATVGDRIAVHLGQVTDANDSVPGFGSSLQTEQPWFQPRGWRRRRLT